MLSNPVLLAKHRREIPGYYPKSRWSSPCTKLLLAMGVLLLVAFSMSGNYGSMYDYMYDGTVATEVTPGKKDPTSKSSSLRIRSVNGTASRVRSSVGTTTIMRTKDVCSAQWTSDSMRGRCFGLKSVDEFDGKEAIASNNNKRYTLADCRAACCKRETCVTWQLAQQTGRCQIGGPVRLGLEGVDTVDWCEPLPPARWLGRFVGNKRSGEDKDKCLVKGSVDFDGKSINIGAERSGQCFGLGPERLKDGKRVHSRHDCEEECCENQHCVLYQWHKDRGCFFNDEKANSDFNCDSYNGTYYGGRKNMKIKSVSVLKKNAD